MRADPGLRDCVPGVVVQRDASGAVHALGSAVGNEYRVRLPGRATFAFRPGEPEVRVAAEPTTPWDIVEELFLTVALPFLLQAEGYEALHASAVHMPGGVVAFCGFSGSGKTTVAYGLARRGYEVWADDAVVLAPPRRGGRAWSSSRLPHPFNLRPESRRFFGLGLDDEVDVGAARSEEEALAAVVVLEPERGRTADVARLPLSVAVTAVLPHAYCFFAAEGRRQRTTAAYLDLAARAPVFRLRVPEDFAGFEAALDMLEDSLSDAVAV